MKTELYVKRISKDQLITPDGKPTIEKYYITDGKTSAPDYTISVDDLDGELVGWKYECTDYDKESNSLTMTFIDNCDPEDYLDAS